MAFALDGGVGIDFTENVATPTQPLGFETTGSDQARYRYVKAASTITAGDVVKIRPTGLVEPLTTAISAAEPTWVGVCNTSLTALYYGWCIIEGPCNVNTAASCVQDVKLLTTTVAGQVDDAGTDTVQGLKIITTIVGAAVTPGYIAGRAGTNNQD